jgi:hypothetical protein
MNTGAKHKLKILGAYTLGYAILASAATAKATERFDFFRGVRQVGMGGASIAVVNDETALLANPAALGKIRQPIVTLIDPEIQGNANLVTLGSTDTGILTNPQKLLSALTQQSNWNKNVFAKASIFPSFVSTNFGIGLYGTDQVNGIVDSTGTNFNLDYTNDYALALGYNFRFFDGRIKLGVAGRAIDRTEIHTVVPASSTNLSVNGLAASGQGIAADVGLILTAPWDYLPSLAIVARDVGTTSFTLNHGMINPGASQYPRSVATSADVGVSISPIIGRNTRMQLTAEYQDVITASTEKDQLRRVHAGIEFNLNDLIFLRGGLNQRYWTAGFEFDTGHVQIQLASYGEEIGTSTTPLEDRRYVVKVGLRF